jgi:putative MATE family efflux protein
MTTVRELDQKKLSLWVLAWPIMVEMLLNFLMGIADTLMVSRISDHAVSAVGLSTQILNSINALFLTVNAGAGVIVAQKCGAGKWEEARKTSSIALKANLVIGVLLSFLMFFSAESILRLMNSPEEVMEAGITYLSLVGAATLFVALQTAMSAIIRNTGNTRGPMIIAMGMNVIHLVLNYLLIFGAFGFPELGIVGVAISTIISRFIALLFSFWLMRRSFEPIFTFQDFRGWDKSLVKEVMAIGWPMSFGGVSWNYTQSVIFAIVASMGAVSLTAFTYINTLMALPAMVGFSMAMASQIRIGHMYGAKNYDEAFKSAYLAWYGGFIYVLCVSIAFYPADDPLIHLFTQNAEIIAAAVPLFLINIVLQPLKMLNMSFGSALNGVGDTRYVAAVSVTVMWLFAAGGAYLFGHVLSWGLIGIYFAMISDELVRGLLVWRRWRKKKFYPAHLRDGQPSSSLTV